MPTRMHVNEVNVSGELVRRLVEDQMPQLADRDLSIVEPWGTDNAIWRLGEHHVVRLPRIDWAVNQVAFEAEWLPRLAPHLTVQIPEPVAIGEPGHGYPYRWAVHRWLPGVGASLERIDDPIRFALDLAKTVQELWAIPTTGAPPAKNRARALDKYDEATRKAIWSARHLVDATAASAIWDEALAAPPHGSEPVWVHGDLEGNCLLQDGRLSGLLDWSLGCAGDPAVEVQTLWSPLFTREARQAFLDELDIDDATIARAKGAAINQACAALPYYLDTYPLIVERSWHKLAELGVRAV